MTWVHRWQAVPPWQRVLGGFVLGILAGVLLGSDAMVWLGPLGTAYLMLLLMALLPLVAFSVMRAVPLLQTRVCASPWGRRTLAWYAVTAVLAVAVALGVGEVLQPGLVRGGPIDLSGMRAPGDVAGSVSGGWDLVPLNPFSALGEGRVLQVMLFAGLVGFALARLGQRTGDLRRCVGQASEAMVQVNRFVMALAPWGVFGLVAALVGQGGWTVLLPLAWFALALYVACVLHMLVVYGGLMLAHGLDPLKFLRAAATAMRVAFVSSSSAAAQPAGLQAAEHRLGVPRTYAAYALPLGASIKMDGCSAIYPVLAAVFAAQFHGIELGAAQQVAILLASVLGGFGTIGVPGTSTVMVTLVLAAAGLPLHVLGLLLAVDRWLDPLRTMTNVTGQLLVPVLVARETGTLDRTVYRNG